MADIRDHVHFLLNDETVVLDDLKPDLTLLDFLRLEKRLRGSKEGCAEGDCGACTVLVGRVVDGGLRYESVNTCIRFVASLDGCHVVSIEHLRRPDGTLHPVQQAMVDHHGSQCGFCTPGIVMSLYGLWMENPSPTRIEVEETLQGNLCRCTGYAPILKAADAIDSYGKVEADPLVAERDKVIAILDGFADDKRVDMGSGAARFILPVSIDDLAEVLDELPEARIVAGATDIGLWVTKFMREIGPVVFTGQIQEFHLASEDAVELTLAGGVTYSEAMPAIDTHLPQLSALWRRIGGNQVRNMGTVGGNIANGSPIGDTPPPLIALGARIVLRRGDARREVLLEEFFIAYGKQDWLPGEFVEKIIIPIPKPDEQFAVYKISKRRDEDISTLCAAFRGRSENGVITEMVIAYGGMAATPKRASKTEAALIGHATDDESAIDAAVAALAEDFSPISDMRASAEYRMLVAQNLLRRYLLETDGVSAQLTRAAE